MDGGRLTEGGDDLLGLRQVALRIAAVPGRAPHLLLQRRRPRLLALHRRTNLEHDRRHGALRALPALRAVACAPAPSTRRPELEIQPKLSPQRVESNRFEMALLGGRTRWAYRAVVRADEAQLRPVALRHRAE